MDDLRQHPAFQKMEREKQEMIEQLIQALQGKKLAEALPIVTNWNKQLTQRGLAFTAEENALLTTILSEQMTPAQKKQYEALQVMLKKGRHKRSR
jgi:hypothetical protein